MVASKCHGRLRFKPKIKLTARLLHRQPYIKAPRLLELIGYVYEKIIQHRVSFFFQSQSWETSPRLSTKLPSIRSRAKHPIGARERNSCRPATSEINTRVVPRRNVLPLLWRRRRKGNASGGNLTTSGDPKAQLSSLDLVGVAAAAAAAAQKSSSLMENCWEFF